MVNVLRSTYFVPPVLLRLDGHQVSERPHDGFPSDVQSLQHGRYAIGPLLNGSARGERQPDPLVLFLLRAGRQYILPLHMQAPALPGNDEMPFPGEALAERHAGDGRNRTQRPEKTPVVRIVPDSSLGDMIHIRDFPLVGPKVTDFLLAQERQQRIQGGSEPVSDVRTRLLKRHWLHFRAATGILETIHFVLQPIPPGIQVADDDCHRAYSNMVRTYVS